MITRDMIDADVLRQCDGDPGVARVLQSARSLHEELERTGLSPEQYYDKFLAPHFAPPKPAYVSPRCQVIGTYSGVRCSHKVTAEGKCFQHLKVHYAKVERLDRVADGQ